MKINIEEICRNIKQWIYTEAKNVDGNYNSLPAPFKNGFIGTYTLGTTRYHTMKVSMEKEYNSMHNQVSSSTVSSQFNSFMKSKGFDITKSGLIELTASKLLYFVNCIQAFITAKMVLVISDTNFGINDHNYNVTTDTGSTPGIRTTIIYDAVNGNYPAISSIPDDVNSTITASGYNTYLSNIQNNLATTVRSQKIIYNQKGALSSSSSCSSSSCSSSCSFFIAHTF